MMAVRWWTWGNSGMLGEFLGDQKLTAGFGHSVVVVSCV